MTINYLALDLEFYLTRQIGERQHAQRLEIARLLANGSSSQSEPPSRLLAWLRAVSASLGRRSTARESSALDATAGDALAVAAGDALESECLVGR